MQMGIWLAVDMFMADLLWRWMPNLTMRIANERGPDGINDVLEHCRKLAKHAIKTRITEITDEPRGLHRGLGAYPEVLRALP
jgi:hypothetical protein